MNTKHAIHLAITGEHYACAESQDVLRAMEALGRRGIPIGCRNGGCGLCKVRITEGEFAHSKMSRAFVSESEEHDGVVLACRVFPRGDLAIEPLAPLARCINRHKAQA
jgi:ferredoxin